MTYAEKILGELDRRLDSPIELTLYGRAAFLLGFENPPIQFSQSLDVDGVLWVGQAEALEEETNFWDALEGVNQVLEVDGYYMSHLFEETQVILRQEWRQARQRILGDWKNLTLFRLSDEDLLLSKLMRDDPQDRQDALFIVERRSWSQSDLKALFLQARVPPIMELEEQFEFAKAKLLAAIV